MYSYDSSSKINQGVYIIVEYACFFSVCVYSYDSSNIKYVYDCFCLCMCVYSYDFSSNTNLSTHIHNACLCVFRPLATARRSPPDFPSRTEELFIASSGDCNKSFTFCNLSLLHLWVSVLKTHYIYTHAYIHKYIYTYIHTYLHTRTHTQ